MANTGRMNLLEEVGRIDAEKSNRNRRAEKKRVVGELNKGYKKRWSCWLQTWWFSWCSYDWKKSWRPNSIMGYQDKRAMAMPKYLFG